MIDKNRKAYIVQHIEQLEDRIADYESRVHASTKCTIDKWLFAETVSADVTKLNGYISELRGMCVALNDLGFYVTWKGHHVESIDWGEE